MRLIVMSDSHSAFHKVKTIVEANKDTADTFIHLGDGVEEFEDVHSLYPQLHFIAVKGNNDWGSMEPKTRIITSFGKRIVLTHGDIYNVKYSTKDLEEAARKEKADIVLYGHTHYAQVRYLEDGLYTINPGSVLDSRYTPCSYLCLDLTPAGVVPNIREIK